MKWDSAIKYNKRASLHTRLFVQNVVGVKEDGDLGPKSCEAIAWWQDQNALEADGKVGPKTWAVMCPPLPRALHPLPKKRWPASWGPKPTFDHFQDWPMHAPQWASIVSGPDWLSGMLRLVSTHKGGDLFSRGPTSWTSLDGGSAGMCHYWIDTLPALLALLAERHPSLAIAAWGEDAAKAMKSERWLHLHVPPKRGHRRHDPALDGLVAGWIYAMSDARGIRTQVDHWLRYPRSARAAAEDLGWGDELDSSNGGVVLAAITRMCNSRGQAGATRLLRRFKGRGDVLKALESCYRTKKEDGGYGHPKRWQRLIDEPAFLGEAPATLDAGSLLW